MSLRIHSSGAHATASRTSTTPITSFATAASGPHSVVLKMASVSKRVNDLVKALISSDLFSVEEIIEWHHNFSKVDLPTKGIRMGNDKFAEATLQLCLLISCVIRPAFKQFLGDLAKKRQLHEFDKKIKDILLSTIPEGEDVEAVIKNNAECFDEAEIELEAIHDQQMVLNDALSDLAKTEADLDNNMREAFGKNKASLLQANEERKVAAVTTNARLDLLDERMAKEIDVQIANLEDLVVQLTDVKDKRSAMLNNLVGALKK